MKLILKALCLSVLLAFASCSSPKQVPYVVDAEVIPTELLSQVPANPDPVLQPGDLLNIEVTAINMESVIAFNKGMYINSDGAINRLSQNSGNINGQSSEASTAYYLVDPNGDISFPIIGTIHVSGLTKAEVADKIAGEIYPKYVKERPNVEVRLMNFRVVVVGAVGSPGIKRSTSERMNFFEAIALSGDLNIKGERETILLYRTNADGTREVHRLNIHDKNFLLSPYFNLQQNDIIYVVPNKSMANTSWTLNPAVSTTLTFVGGISSIIGLVLTIVNLCK